MANYYYYVYLTTCLVNGKIYVGKCKIRPYHESYYGSGIILCNAIKKYGVENFTKQIISLHETEEECFEAEKYYIEALHARDPEVGYNIASGGPGGRSEASKSKTPRMTLKEAQEAHTVRNSPEYRALVSKNSLKYWADISLEERHRRFTEMWTPERREARKHMLQERLSNEEASAKYRKRLSEAVRAANEKPEVQEKRKQVMNDPELKAHLRKARLAQAADPKQQRLNKEVRQPLAVVTRLLNNGKITQEDAVIRREALEALREEIMNG